MNADGTTVAYRVGTCAIQVSEDDADLIILLLECRIGQEVYCE